MPAAVSTTPGLRGSGCAVASRKRERSTVNVPAPRRAQAYVSRLATRASLYADLQTLLATVQEPVVRAEYRRLVIEDNVLSRRSGAAREKIWKELAAR